MWLGKGKLNVSHLANDPPNASFNAYVYLLGVTRIYDPLHPFEHRALQLVE
jgi:hypothetical protein